MDLLERVARLAPEPEFGAELIFAVCLAAPRPADGDGPPGA